MCASIPLRLLLVLCATTLACTACCTPPKASEDAGTRCDGLTGLREPPTLCTKENPCPNALVGISRATVDEPLTMPACATSEHRRGRPAFDDGAPLVWTDEPSGLKRAACVSRPESAGPPSVNDPNPAHLRPLLVFLHGSGGSARGLYDATSLRQKAQTFDLSGDPARPGFVLAADQGLNQHTENKNPPAARHDIYVRDFASPSHARDLRALDELIDRLVAQGGIDRARIYLSGWSNGAFFSQLYGLARHETATPGGNRIAAVAVFDGGDPLQRPFAEDTGCEYKPAIHSTLPVMIVHRACSIVSCDAAQAKDLDAPPGFAISEWFARLPTITSGTLKDVIIDSDGKDAPCANSCHFLRAAIDHVRWPDGIGDKSGIDREVEMLAFLREHPLRL